MNGAGNDFVMLDNRGGDITLSRDQISRICDRHRGHWRNRQLFVWLGLLFWIVYAITLAVEWDELGKDGSAAALGIFIFGGLFWLIVAAIYATSGIKPVQITDRFIELVGVNKEFAWQWNEIVKPKKKKKLREHLEDDEDEDE